MIKLRFKNSIVQEWYEKGLRAHMKSDKEYQGLTEEEADEKYYADGKGFKYSKSDLKQILED